MQKADDSHALLTLLTHRADIWQPIWLAIVICLGWFLCIRWRLVLWLGLWQPQRGKVTKKQLSEKILDSNEREGSAPGSGHFDVSRSPEMPIVPLLRWCNPPGMSEHMNRKKNSNHSWLWYFTSKCGQLNANCCDTMMWQNVTHRWHINVTTSTSNRWLHAVAWLNNSIKKVDGIKGKFYHERSCILLRCCLPICLHGKQTHRRCCKPKWG